MARERSIVSAAWVIGFCTLLSRITGFARDVCLTSTFGLKSVTDAFWFAFAIPNLLRRLFAEGAIAAVFVPPFSKMLERGEHQAAWRLLARTFALQSLALSVVIALIELGILAAWWHGRSDPAYPHSERGLILALTAIMQPYTLAVCIVALLSSLLNCVGSFAPAALVSALLNVGMLIAIVGIGPAISSEPRRQAVVVAVSVVVSGGVQIAFLLPFLRSHNVPLKWELNASDPDVRRMLASFVPVVLGQGALMLGTFVDFMIAMAFRATPQSGSTGALFGYAFRYPLDEGAIATLNVAQRLYQFPLGVAAISLGIAALPKLSRLLANQDWSAWAREMRSALRLALFIGLLSGVLLVCMGDSFFRLLFQHGKVDAAGTSRATPVIMAYGLGMWAFCAQQIVLRGFYSGDDVRTPLRMSLVLVPLNTLISLALIWQPGIREAAFGIASTVTSSLGVFVGLYLLHRKAGKPLVDATTWSALLRMLAAGMFAGLAVRAATPILLGAARTHGTAEIVARLIETTGGITVGAGVYLGVAWLLRLPEVGLLLRRSRHVTASQVVD